MFCLFFSFVLGSFSPPYILLSINMIMLASLFIKKETIHSYIKYLTENNIEIVTVWYVGRSVRHNCFLAWTSVQTQSTTINMGAPQKFRRNSSVSCKVYVKFLCFRRHASVCYANDPPHPCLLSTSIHKYWEAQLN